MSHYPKENEFWFKSSRSFKNRDFSLQVSLEGFQVKFLSIKQMRLLSGSSIIVYIIVHFCVMF